jgi:Sulfatase
MIFGAGRGTTYRTQCRKGDQVGVSLKGEDRARSSGEVLPFPTTPSASIAGRTMQESVYRRREPERHLPEVAPNILVVLIDDAGPGLPTTFGGEVRTPTMHRVCAEGVTFNRFRRFTNRPVTRGLDSRHRQPRLRPAASRRVWRKGSVVGHAVNAHGDGKDERVVLAGSHLDAIGVAYPEPSL